MWRKNSWDRLLPFTSYHLKAAHSTFRSYLNTSDPVRASYRPLHNPGGPEISRRDFIEVLYQHAGFQHNIETARYLQQCLPLKTSN